MTPDELREARRKLGLSASALASALRLGKGGDRTVRRWEAGERHIPGPVEVALELWITAAGKLTKTKSFRVASGG